MRSPDILPVAVQPGTVITALVYPADPATAGAVRFSGTVPRWSTQPR